MEQDTAVTAAALFLFPSSWTWESLAQLSSDDGSIMEESYSLKLARLIRKRENVSLKEQMEIALELLKLVKENPRLAVQEDSQGLLPLHAAIENNLPLECIKILLEPCPADTVVKVHYSHQYGQFYSPIRAAKTAQVCEFLAERAVSYLRSTLQENGWKAVQSFFVTHCSFEYVVRRLVEEFPEFLAERWHFFQSISCDNGIDVRMLPLHCAILQQAHINILKMLISAYPKALEVTRYWKKDTPLNLAIRDGYVDPDVLRLLCTSKSLQICDSDGEIPLINYLNYEAGPDLLVVQSMVELYPRSARTTNRSGLTPLHLACNKASTYFYNLQVIRFLIEVYPRALVMRDSFGCTPLHGICHFAGQDVLPLMHLLVEGSPEGVRQLDSSGNTVLHRYLLGLTWPILSVVEYLTNVYPGSLQVRDKVKKMTPLDIACTQSQVDVVRFLIRQYPETLESRSRTGTGTSLHTLCSIISKFPDAASHESESILTILDILSISEEAVLAKDRHGQTPLHLLSKAAAPREILQVLVNKFPATLSARDNNGRIPLHSAIQGCCDFYYIEASHDDTIRYLLEAYPLGVRDVDNNDMTPLILACKQNACVSTIYQLVKIDPIASRGIGWSQVPRGSPNVWSSFRSAIGSLFFG